ncbi:MAG: hypothetical protein J5871_00755 [Bacteroidales bacterium]|nr:hypothetical protein [Bacteroidales bacterium]
MNGMKRFLLLLVCCLPLLAAVSCVSALRQVSVRSCCLETLSPVGLSRLDVRLRVGVDNPARAFCLREIAGCVKWDGVPLADFTADDLVVERGPLAEYPVLLHLSLAEGVTGIPLHLFSANADLSSLTLDLSARVEMRGGERKKISLQDISVQELMQKASEK